MTTQTIKSSSIKLAMVSASLLILGACASSSGEKTKAEEDCLAQDGGYWYNKKCWAFEDDSIAKGDIDNIVKERMATFKKRRLKIGEASYPLLSAPADYNDGKLNIYVVYQVNDRVKTFALSGVPLDDATYANGGTFKDGIPKFLDGSFDSEGAFILEKTGSAVVSMNSNEEFVIKGEIYDISTATNGNPPTNFIDYELVIDLQGLFLGTSKMVVVDNEAHLLGDLGTITYHQVKTLIADHPTIKTIVMRTVGGSVDDKVNMHTGRLLRENGFTTKLLEDSHIASGGVDLFTAGRERIVTKGAKLGVHSWCCLDGEGASKADKDHPGHKDQIDYFTEMLGKKGYDFYFFTLNASDFSGMYYMTDEDMKKFGVATKFVE